MVAGSAALHEQIASKYAPGDDLPCADTALLVPLKKSSEYRAIHRRVASPKAIDSWQENELHFFVFQLHPLSPHKKDAMTESMDAPVVVFCMHRDAGIPISAVVVTPNPSGKEAEIMDLRDPKNVYTAPI